MPSIRDATETDIPELVRLRGMLFDSLGRTSWGAPPAGDGWRAACAEELRRELVSQPGTMKVLVIDGDGGLACCGIGVFDRRLPSPYNPVGLVGHVFGVVTDPAYRGRGHARAIMAGLLGWFDERGIRRVDLNASPEAQSLYRGLGFADHPGPMLSRRR
jgi:ribosomal protein S18 acetylase RimI-like enzyme